MKFKQLIAVFSILIPSFFTQAQIENVLVEKYYVSDDFDALDTNGGHLLAGTTTYRIFVDLPKGSKLLKIYGEPNHPFSIKSSQSFFNATDGVSFGKDLKKSSLANNTVALDSWLTLGQICKPNYYGIPKEQDVDGSFIGGSNNDGGSSKLPFGLLTNIDPQAGTPITIADGMVSTKKVDSLWNDYGVKNFLNPEIDSTIFGSIVQGNEFTSKNFLLKNSGTTGIDTLKNQVLIAQLTTAGELTFSLNIEVLEMINGVPTIVQYVSNDSILIQDKDKKLNEKFSGFLKYPFTCGCVDKNYLEFNPRAVCDDKDACKTKIVLGCTDKMACNYDPTANVMIHNLCCYPGSCNNRDIALVCPSFLESALTFDIHPNPTENNLFLNAKTGSEQLMSYEIYDVFGTKVISKELGTKSTIVDEEVSTEQLSKGIYHIRLTVGNATESQTFIKN